MILFCFHIFVCIDLQSELSGANYLTNTKNAGALDMDENSPISEQFTSQDKIKSFYIEGKLLNNEQINVIGLGIKTETNTAIYHWGDGVILSDNQIIHCKGPCQPCKPGDVIGCRVSLEVYKTGNQTFHHVIFSRNGDVASDPIILEGHIPTSIFFLCDARCEDTLVDEIVDLNFGDRVFTYNIGNYDCLSK